MVRVLADDISVFDMTGINEGGSRVNQGVQLIAACPAVINRATGLTFTVKEPAANATARVYDIQGHLVKKLTAGSRKIAWSLKDDSGHSVPAGTYILRYEQGRIYETRKIVLTD